MEDLHAFSLSRWDAEHWHFEVRCRPEWGMRVRAPILGSARAGARSKGDGSALVLGVRRVVHALGITGRTHAGWSGLAKYIAYMPRGWV